MSVTIDTGFDWRMTTPINRDFVLARLREVPTACEALECGVVTRSNAGQAPGRWAWVLENVRPLPEPIPARGAQGLWTWRPAHIGEQRHSEWVQ